MALVQAGQGDDERLAVLRPIAEQVAAIVADQALTDRALIQGCPNLLRQLDALQQPAAVEQELSILASPIAVGHGSPAAFADVFGSS